MDTMGSLFAFIFVLTGFFFTLGWNTLLFTSQVKKILATCKGRTQKTIKSKHVTLDLLSDLFATNQQNIPKELRKSVLLYQYLVYQYLIVCSWNLSTINGTVLLSLFCGLESGHIWCLLTVLNYFLPACSCILVGNQDNPNIMYYQFCILVWNQYAIGVC